MCALVVPTAREGADPRPVVSIIIVSYNTRELTLACLRSLAEQTKIRHEVILVDNASHDGSAAAVIDEFPGVHVIESDANLGFARANNAAADVGTAEFLLLLNPDTVVLNGAVDRLIAFARSRPENRIWGGRTVFADGRLNPSSCWRRPGTWTAFCRATALDQLFAQNAVLNSEAYGGWQRDTERSVDIVSGCFFLIERELWDALGGFDPTFVMYGEEADLCLRAVPHGARPVITPTAEIVHLGGASERVRSDRLVRLLSAKVTLARRHASSVARPISIALVRAWPLSRVIGARAAAALAPTNERRRSRAEWRSIWERRSLWWNGYGTSTATCEGASAYLRSRGDD